MYTPVSEEGKTSASTDVDLSVRMQHMIDLQNDQIRMSRPYSGIAARRGEPPDSTVPGVDADAGAESSMGTKPMYRSIRRSSLQDLSQAQEPIGGLKDELHSQEIRSDNFHMLEPDVGTGTLYFNTEILGSVEAAEGRRLLTPMPLATHGMKYGSAGAPVPYASPEAYPNNRYNENQEQCQSFSPRAQNQYIAPEQQYSEPVHPTNSHSRLHSNCDSVMGTLKMCFIWLGKLVLAFFCCSVTDVEQLQRSFCYGAIDGMLTGSGIVAAFCGMNVLAPTSTLTIRKFVVAFSAAACFADSLCMALGHVWTTYVLVSTQAKERTITRASVDQNKVDAKGNLVDMLLDRGMLKIDAMSLADTLEGYPDMFVSALVGDALIAGGVGGNADSSMDLSARRRSVSTGKLSPSASRGWSGHRWSCGDDYTQHVADQDLGRGNGNFVLWKLPSYSQHVNELDNEIDPEASVVGAAMEESRREGLFMMIGFSVFAVVPSVIFLICPMLVSTHEHGTTELHSDAQLYGGRTSATSIVVTTAAAIMWCLGVWKSRFLDSNWMLFGIETVVVMLVCIAAAFCVGSMLRAWFPELGALIDATPSTVDTPSAEA